MSESKRSPSSIIKDDSPAAKKRARKEAEEQPKEETKKEEQPKEILDLAPEVGLADGTRLEVKWEVDGQLHWWGATLLPWNNEVVDECVAVRQLKYDTCPEHGFDEESVEQAVFLGENLLTYPDSGEELYYRREGEDFTSEEEGSPLKVSPAELVEQTLDNVMAKHKQQFEKLPAAMQAHIAEQISKKREQLIEQLKSNPGVVTKSKMQEILAGLWNGEGAGAKVN